MLLISLLILSCCFVALCRFVLLYADGALRHGTHFISLSSKVFFVIYLYITLFCSLCCPPSVSSLLCPARSPPVSSSLYTALYRFTQILMIPFSFLLRLRVSPSRTEPGIKHFPKTYSIKWYKPWHKAPA